MAWRFALAVSGLLIPVSLLYACYRYTFNYFEWRGIPHMRSAMPLYRNNFKHLLQRIYNHFKTDTPIAGVFLNETPAIVILDLELIKRVLIEDFTNFRDRFNDKSSSKDLLHTFVNEKWEASRRKLTPCFWSAKMDFIFPSVLKAAAESSRQIPVVLESERKNLDLKIFCTNYATNAFLSCVFSTELNQNKADESAKALSMLMRELLTYEYDKRFSPNAVMTNICWGRCTTHSQSAKSEASTKLERAVRTLLEERRAHEVKGNDILQLFIDMLVEESDERTLQWIIQTLGMLVTGFANTAKMLTHCLHELACNKEIQQQLRLENERVMQNYENTFGYEAMGHMHYLDQVVAETLRKYPISELLIRHTLNDYQVPGTSYTIERDTCVLIPVYAIHHDPAIYPAPEQFDPSRFDAETVMARHSCAYLSFDDGPRNCMGKRLSKMLIKVAVVRLLGSYRIFCEHGCFGSANTVDVEREDAPNELHVNIEKVF